MNKKPPDKNSHNKNNIEQIEKSERIQRAKNKIRLIRTKIATNKSHKMLQLVREYIHQRPEIAVNIVKKWL